MNDTGPSMEEPPGATGEVGVPPPGYRLPGATHPGPIRLQVADLERSRQYYSTVLGLVEIGSSPGMAQMGAPSGEPLITLIERLGAAPVPRRGRLGLYHFALLLPDRSSLGSFLSHLAKLGIQAGMSDHSVSEAIYLNDPDGLGIEIYADRPRSEWQYSGREIHMVTEPLRAREVIAAATAPWQGMPAGTSMGHLHLFVGNLERAADFYHRALGLDRVVWSYPGALFLSAGGYHHHLGINIWAAGAAPAGPDDARLLEWSLLLPDADAIRAAGESLTSAGFPVQWNEEGWTADDPWGTTLRVSSHPVT